MATTFHKDALLRNNILNNLRSSHSTPTQSPELRVLSPESDIIIDSTNSICDNDPTNKNFTITWHELTCKVDLTPWYIKLKPSCFRRCDSNEQVQQQQSQTNHQTNNLNVQLPPPLPHSHSSCSIATSQTLCSSKQRDKNVNSKTVLNNICGSIKSGQLTAILGPSGAGKSTLLHCLFQNRTNGVNGKILCSGNVKKKLKICYIPQKDYLIEYLTVKEDLIFVSKLRDSQASLLETSGSNKPNNDITDVKELSTNGTCLESRSSPHMSHEEKVSRVGELLGLTSCMDVVIGNISGGQLKRLSIAREILSNPDILILDEPTTGLDSLSCLKTVRVLRSIVNHSIERSKPMAVVLVLHQPQTEVFNMFDRTYFISKFGQAIYDDNPCNVVQTLNEVGMQLPTSHYNPASFLVEIASGEFGQEVMYRLSKKYQQKFRLEYNVEELLRSAKKKNRSLWSISATNRLRSGLDAGDSTTTTPDTSLMQRKTDNNNNAQSCSFEQTSQKLVLTSKSAPNTPLQRSVEKSRVKTSKKVKYFISSQLSDCYSSHQITMKQSFKHLWVLVHRCWLSLVRNPSMTKYRLLFHILCPLLALLVFGSENGSPNACPELVEELDIGEMQKEVSSGATSRRYAEIRLTYENMAYFFILVFAFCLNSSTVTSSLYPLTMQMFKKEIINGLYRPLPYLVAQTLVELPLEIILPFISVFLSYHLTGQPHSYLEWRMFAMGISFFLITYIFHGVGLLCGSIFVNNVNAAMLVAQSCVLPASMFAGFVIRPDRMQPLMRMVSHVAPFKLNFQVMVASRYGFGVCACDEDIYSNGSVDFVGLSPATKRVLEYMFPRNDTNPETRLAISPTELFSKLSNKYFESKTFGLDLNSCKDVKPFIMHAMSFDDSHLFKGIIGNLIFLIVVKLITFSIVTSLPYRIKS